MSQQGGRPARRDDDWWRQLYDDSTEDTGPSSAPDSLDDRFASARNTVAGRPGGRPGSGAEPGAEGGDGDDDGGTTGTRRPQEPSVPGQRAPHAPPGGPPAGRPAPAAPAPPTEPPEAPPVTPPVPAEPPRAAQAAPRVPAPPSEPPEAPPVTPPAPAGPPPAPGLTPPAPPAEPPAATTPPGPPAAGGEPPAPPGEPPQAAPRTPAQPPPDSAAPVSVDYVGSGPPTYDPEPTALPTAEPDELGDLVPDTVLDGARYGACTLRAVSLRGDSARYRGEPRRDALLTARFGSGEQALLLVAMATGARATPGAHLAAAEACRWIGRAVGRSHQRLVEDLRAARRGDLKSGLHRLTDRSLGRLRASAAEQGADPEEYTATLRCLLLPADPDCRTRVFFGVGDGGLFRLRDGEWQDIEPRPSAAATTGAPVVGFGSPPAETPEGDRLTLDFGIPTPPSPYEPAPQPPREPFRFRASVARPGDALVMCTEGLAGPLRGEAALCAYLARRWSGRAAPGLAAFLADAQVRVKGYADDRTAAAVWEA
ncbi:protein phosphatase 2C domain-containing protein [Streptomyces sp. PanSC9]|uniref:protein phosphatase 2C domain-containing protein n=1 Tax=Streptomyces sp. PanSC9 TaxID=1520461 RepID=UPI000F488B26|nr:protein phosphatase 2C domain-containing protein [Streptomyces sp. PanSC9]ROP46369.1 protein phosphatase 2C-like protein [Streptomyces sp. PanSC9]